MGSHKLMCADLHTQAQFARSHVRDQQMPQAQNTVLGNTPPIKRARTTHNPTKLNKASEGGGQKGQKATGMLALLGSDYNMTSAPLGSGWASSSEANILMGSEVLRKAAEEAQCSGMCWDLLSGRRSPVTRALRQQGQVCVTFDTLSGLDMICARLTCCMCCGIECSKVAPLSVALLCGSWSSARHGIPGSTCLISTGASSLTFGHRLMFIVLASVGMVVLGVCVVC